MTMTDLKFKYICNLDRDEDDCSPDLQIDVTITDSIKFSFAGCFFETPLLSKVDDVIYRLKNGDKFDKGVTFRINHFTHEEFISIHNNKLKIENFSISLDIIRENLTGMFDMMKKQLDKAGDDGTPELVKYMNDIYNYPPESLPIIKKLDGKQMLIYDPTDKAGCFDMTTLSETQKIIDYLEHDDKKILDKGVFLKNSGCRLRLGKNDIDLDYGFDGEMMCPLRTELEKTNLIRELKALVV
jgi:hypothetical protein